jgi:hypothetical protein
MRGLSNAPAEVTDARAASTDWPVARSNGLNCRTRASKLAVSNSGTSAARLGPAVCAALAVLAGVEAKAETAPVPKTTEMAKHAMVLKECMCSSRSQGRYSTKNGMIKENTQINPNIKGGIERKKRSFGQSHWS